MTAIVDRDFEKLILRAVKTSAEFIALIGSSAGIIWVNDAIIERQGIPREKITGSHFRNLLDSNLSDLAEEILITIVSDGFFHGELLMRGRTGSFPASISAGFVQPTEDKSDFMILFVASDRSYIKQHEMESRKRTEFLNSIINRAPVGIFCLDMNGDFSIVNDSLRKIIRKTDVSFLTGENIRDMRKVLNPQISHAIELGLTGLKTDLSDVPLLVAKTSSPIVNVMTAPISSSDGSDAGVAVLIEDRTEKFRIAEQMQEANRLASIGVLAAGVAHSVNNPLTVILGNIEVLRGQAVKDGQETMSYDLIQSNLERIGTIAKDLLYLSRRKASEKGNVNLNELASKAKAFFKLQPKFKWIEMDLESDDDVPVIRGDVTQIEQIFQDLFINALQAIGKEGRILVRTSYDSVSNEVVIRISDTGCGIAKENIDSIFDAFFTTKELGEGTGLGLAVCYTIVKQHGGSIEVEETSPKGTTFAIRLPVSTQKSDGEL
ncbi:PAS domain-containing protein [bacterium]|nr:PAS domain-containing protein [bacterium]MBU1024840.1 PAS domain-containing protein [bacterium]